MCGAFCESGRGTCPYDLQPMNQAVHASMQVTVGGEAIATVQVAAPVVVKTDEERRARLRRMTRIATGMLVCSGIVLIVARIFQTRYPWLAYVVATAEAAMVGGLADWFAVTAL